MLGAPFVFDQLDGQPVEQLRMRRRATEFAKVIEAREEYLLVVTTGAIGLILFLVFAGSILRQAFADARESKQDPALDHLYTESTPLIVIGWLAGALFDSPHTSGMMLGLLAIVITVTLPRRVTLVRSFWHSTWERSQ